MTRCLIPGHRPGKAGHLVLRRLALGHRVHLGALIAAADINPRNARGRKFPRLLASMVRDGLMASSDELYWISDAGRAVLERLERGEGVVMGPAVPVPNLRVFSRREAA